MNQLSAHRRSVIFLALSTLLETLYVFGLDAVQKTMKTEKNVNELFGPPEKRSFLALSILLETVHMFRLNAVQKTMKTEK